MKRLLVAAWHEVDARVATVAVALLLVMIGCWLTWRPGCWLVPGVVLLWLALPSRKPFIDRSPGGEAVSRRKP